MKPLKPSNTFSYIYYLECGGEDFPVIEIPMEVNCYYEPADPNVGFDFPSITIESIEITCLTDEENERFWRDMDISFNQKLEIAAWEHLKKINEQADAEYLDAYEAMANYNFKINETIR